jgi:hypothetical protein
VLFGFGGDVDDDDDDEDDVDDGYYQRSFEIV